MRSGPGLIWGLLYKMVHQGYLKLQPLHPKFVFFLQTHDGVPMVGYVKFLSQTVCHGSLSIPLHACGKKIHESDDCMLQYTNTVDNT